MERRLFLLNQLPTALLAQTETYPANLKQFAVLAVPPPAIYSQLTVQRVSPNCSYGTLLCAGVHQSATYLVPNKMVLRAGSAPGNSNNPYAFLSISGSGHHANIDQRMTLENTLYNASYITARVGTTSSVQNNQVNLCNCILIAPAHVTGKSYPFIHDITTFYTDMQMDADNNNYILQNASVQQLAGGNAYGSLLYSQYQYPGVRAGRQVVLTAAGIIVVVDSVYNQGVSHNGFNGGLTYRLWPSVAASGSNWALQGPLNAISSSAVLPPTTNMSTLFWINSAAGRTIGRLSEPLSDFGTGTNVPGQTVTTLYAYDSVTGGGGGVNTTHVFVSVLYPLSNPTAAEATTIASHITVKVNSSDNSTIVSIPNHSAVVVPPLNLVPPAGSLVVWLSAKSLPSSTWGRPLQSWPDSSGNHHNFTQLNSASPTTVNATAMKGYPGVWMNGSHSQGMVGPSVFPVNSDYTVTALLISPVTNNWRQGVIGSLTGAQHAIAVIIGTGSGHINAVHNVIVPLSAMIYGPLAINQPLLITFTWQQSSGQANLYFNGTLVANYTSPYTVTVNDPSVVVGAYNNPSQNYVPLTAFVSEVLILNYTLSTASRLAIEHYIRASYGILGTAAAKAGTLEVPAFM